MQVAFNLEQLLHGPRSGIGRYTARLAAWLPRVSPDLTLVGFTALHRRAEVERALQQAGARAAAGEGPAPAILPVVRPLLYDLWHRTGRPSLATLAPRLRRCNLIHAPSVACPPRRRLPLVVTVHDLAPALYPEAFTARGRRFHAEALRAVADQADLVIAVSEAAAAEIVSHGGIERSRIRVVPHGIDRAGATPDEVEAAARRYGLAGRPYVLWVGALEPRKNVEALLGAWPEVRAAGLPHRLVLAGGAGWGGTAPAVARAAEALGDDLRRLGPVPDTDLPALYRGAAVFAFPSRHEGFGLPILEAMAQGTPVVCSSAPALVEVAGGAARHVAGAGPDDWAEALVDLLGDDEAWAGLAAAGPARAAAFTWEGCAAATLEVYREALNPVAR